MSKTFVKRKTLLAMAAALVANITTTQTAQAEPCVKVYEHSNYKGDVNTLCPGSSKVTGFSMSSFPNDSISSISVPEGLAVEGCEHSDGSGQCRTYFTSSSYVGSKFNDEFSRIRVIRFNYDDFMMTISSDPQYPWSCGASGGSCDDTSIADRDNERQVASMNAILSNYGKSRVAGSIINGDLTAFGHDWQFDKYREFYEDDLKINNYAGLGNHDIENNVNDCWENNCATRMANYLEGQVNSLNVKRFDYRVSGSYYKFPAYRKDHNGSMAYSWDVGDVHFVQLNNHPIYTTNWNGWNFGSALRDYFNISSALSWLRSDLRDAANEGKKIILNFHDWNASAYNSEFMQILKDYNVSAIFAGHIHSTIGKVSQYTDLHGPGKHLPVFRSGSVVYHDYLLAQFKNDQLIVKQVDSSNGSNYSLSTVGTYPMYGNATKSLSGSWSSSGGRNTSHSGNPSYGFKLDSNQSVTFNLTSSIDTYLYLKDAKGNVIGSNDDVGNGYNSRLTKNLSAGNYSLVAATYSSGKSGSFNLSTNSGSLIH